MNAPATHVQASLALSAIVASKLNPRKTFNKAKDAELASSVKRHGILHPILVRPLATDGRFEIVIGERRYNAAKMAELIEMPVTIRELTDTQALELAVVENQQRDDLHPLEEAEGYEALLKCTHENGSKYTVDDIAEKVGKSKWYVYKKLQLTALCSEARKAFYGGTLDFSRALLISRIAGEQLQRQALKEIAAPRFAGGEPMTSRDAARHVQQNYMLALDKAPFSPNDETLVPTAGSCVKCPKRTGNAPELFDDVKSGDVCTDPPCFTAKREAHTVRLVKAAEAKGTNVIHGAEARKIAPQGIHGAAELKDYYVLDGEMYCGNGFKKIRQLLGKDAPKPDLLEDPETGRLVEVVKRRDVEHLIKAKVKSRAVGGAGRANGAQAKQRAKEQKAKAERELLRRIYFAAREDVAKKGMGLEDVRVVVSAVWERHWHEHKAAIAPWWQPEEKAQGDRIAALTKRIPTMDGADLVRLLVDCAMVSNVIELGYGRGGSGGKLEAFAKRHGVDIAAIKREAGVQQRAAKAKPSKKPTPAKRAKKVN